MWLCKPFWSTHGNLKVGWNVVDKHSAGLGSNAIFVESITRALPMPVVELQLDDL